MPEYSKIIENLERAEQCVSNAEDSLKPISRAKQVDAYIIGLLGILRSVLKTALRAAKMAQRAQGLPPKKRASKTK